MSQIATEGEKSMNEEKSFLRWGGLAGILAGVFFLCTIVTLIEFGPSTTATTPAALINNFPNVRTGLAAGNTLYFLVSVGFVGLGLGLYRALRGTGIALYGTVLYLLGVGVTFVETTTQVAFDPISNLYHASGVTAADQHTLTLMWQSTQGMFNQLDTSATLLLSTGLVVLGVAMIRSSAFGKFFGGLSVVAGAARALGDILGFDQFHGIRSLRPSRLPCLPSSLGMEALQAVKGRITVSERVDCLDDESGRVPKLRVSGCPQVHGSRETRSQGR